MISEIREEVEQYHPPYHTLRYFLREKSGREGKLGKFREKSAVHSKVTWQVNPPGRLSAIREKKERHLALDQLPLRSIYQLSSLWKEGTELFSNVCSLCQTLLSEIFIYVIMHLGLSGNSNNC